MLITFKIYTLNNLQVCNTVSGFFFNLNLFIYLFIYLWLRLGLHCCAQAFSSCDERGLLFVAVHGLLIAVASLVVEHRL